MAYAEVSMSSSQTFYQAATLFWKEKVEEMVTKNTNGSVKLIISAAYPAPGTAKWTVESRRMAETQIHVFLYTIHIYYMFNNIQTFGRDCDCIWLNTSQQEKVICWKRKINFVSGKLWVLKLSGLQRLECESDLFNFYSSCRAVTH